MAVKKKRLFTIGYEQTPARSVLDELEKAGVKLLVDVRAVASSRRAGFSKNQLAAGLDERGIAYLHLRGLGTPKEGRLAARSGIQLRYLEIAGAPKRQPGQRSRLIEAHAEAQKFYAEQLLSPEAIKAREFLAERGFDQTVAQKFGCGYAPSGWDALTKHLLAKGFTGQELTIGGLARESARGGLIDRYVADVVRSREHPSEIEGNAHLLISSLGASFRRRTKIGTYGTDLLYKLGMLGTMVGFVLC